ncbi:tetraacyldisaccharide 4'-kinase [Methylocystis sp. WRRC1]|uniref:tetraacyldisaccharide 4'-kinase n=1 Tax=Methylocystis sp. WRRC1 TaxID=1732014 RepID=UPI001D13FA10|nr:tetraacyldisaccharide 4'-kinase [Methylocystis sp. WRRC1]MCC3246598.1 tetraacyldisaccharide 4'-kinase [Methylocystis sp. WRRC1]
MRAPNFWRADGLSARLLAPAGAVYGAVAKTRLVRRAPRAALPTIVVGGLTTGGDGKTPLALALAESLLALGEQPAILTRGYGRKLGRREPFVVDSSHVAEDAGDEAILLARVAPTIVGADRVAGAAMARELGASVILLDDGFHSRRLASDLALLAVDSEYGAGNARCLPAGPLRAPLDAQLSAADALVVIGDGAQGAKLARRSGKSVFTARIVPDPKSAGALAGARVVAFAGIARPDKFLRTLSETGAEIVATKFFGDHHRFSRSDYAALSSLRRQFDARLVTTEKDAPRIDASAAGLRIETLPVTLAFDDPAAIEARLSAALARARISRAS